MIRRIQPRCSAFCVRESQSDYCVAFFFLVSSRFSPRVLHLRAQRIELFYNLDRRLTAIHTEGTQDDTNKGGREEKKGRKKEKCTEPTLSFSLLKYYGLSFSSR